MVSTTSHRITYTILSMSLLTVMAGAAVAPALATMFEHFSDCPKVLVQLIVSIPAFFIILTNLLFLEISRHFGSRTIALAGLVLYVASGVCCFFATGIGVLLVMRALLGVSVGLVMPLSTGLLAYYYPPEQQARLMGLSAAMNQIGGVTATLLAGILCTVGWNYSFLVYSLGLIAVVLVALFLPDERLGSSNKRGVPFTPKQLLKFHPSVVGMVLLMTIFFVFVTNFAITASHDGKFSAVEITLIMVGTDVVATFVELFFGKMMRHIPHVMKYLAPAFFIIGFSLYCASDSTAFVLAGSACIGMGNGVGIPYLNTIASIKGGRNSATTVMPLLSAALYLGQFVSPLLVSPVAKLLGDNGYDETVAPYKVAVVLGFLFLFQTFSTRRYQSLPPKE